MYKKIVAVIIALVSFSCLAVAAESFPQPASSVQELNHVVAVVNGEPITQHQFQQFYDRSIKRLRQQHQLIPDIGEMHRYILNQLIDRRLQLQMAKRAGIKVTDKQVEKQIDSIKQQQKMTTAQLKAYVGNLGYTMDEFKKELRDEILIGQLQRQALSDQVTISKEEVLAEYNKLKNSPDFASQYQVIDVLVPLADNASDSQIAKAKQQANAFKAALLAGKSYKTLGSNNVSDLGWRSLDELPNLFASPVEKLSVHGVAGPLQAANGFHVLQLLGKKASKQPMPTLDQIQQHMFMMKLQKQMGSWLKNLRKQSDIQIYDSASS